jgi:hypothetical protein
MKTPHKHAALIHAWADGAEIETIDCNVWGTCNTPRWFPECEYRIKPEPKPDVVEWHSVVRSGCAPAAKPNTKLTFCGETGKLKSAEVLK